MGRAEHLCVDGERRWWEGLRRRKGGKVTAVQIIHGQLAGMNVHAHAAHGKGSERRRCWPAYLGEPKAGAGRRWARLVQVCGRGEEWRRGAEVVGAANLGSEH